MSSLTSNLIDIDLKVKSLIKVNQDLKTQISMLETVQLRLSNDKEQLEKVIQDMEEKVDVLRTANAMLGSDDYKTKMKFKINALVKEIDLCIAQLA